MRLLRLALVLVLAPLLVAGWTMPRRRAPIVAGGANASQIWSMTWDQGIATSAATAYQLPFAPESGDLTADTTEANRRAPMPAAGVVSDLNCKLSGDLGAASDVLTFTIRKNAADTTVVCTITAAGGTEDSCNSGANTATFAVGDLISMSIVTADTPTAVLPSCYLLWTPTVADEFVILAANIFNSTSAQRHYVPQGVSTGTSADTNRAIVMPVAGNITAIYAKSDTTYTGGQTRTFSLIVDTVEDTSLQCVIDSTGDATVCEATGANVELDAGDVFSLRDLPAGTAPSDNRGFGFKFVPTTTGEFPLIVGVPAGWSTTANRYHPMSGGTGPANATEATVAALMPAFTAKSINVHVATTPSVGYAGSLRESAGATTPALSCDTGTTLACAGTATVSLTGGGSALVGMQADPGAAEANATGNASIGVRATYP